MKSIYRIKKGAAPHQVKPLILQACKHLIERSAQAIIAACTEISLAIDKEDVAIPLIDVNEILAEETIRLAFYTD
jgi:aspartate racemase